MYKPRNKYFDLFNSGNIINRIMEAKCFSAYEFMSLRYACCEMIAETYDMLDPKGYGVNYTYSERRDLKNKIKLLQSCINRLDMYYERKVVSQSGLRRLLIIGEDYYDKRPNY